MELYLATSAGFVGAQKTTTGWQIIRHSLEDKEVTSVIARERVILAGTTDGLYASEDAGMTWVEKSNGLAYRHIRWLAYHPDVSDFELAGTEPAAIFVSRDGGESWHGRDEVEQLRKQFGWWLPYSSAAGCVRGFAVHGRRLYAAVEVGGLLRSDDAGATWQLAAGSHGRPEFGRPPGGFIHPDVHAVAVHPTAADLVFAPTGGGFYVSEDGGTTWQCRYDNCYTRAVWANPGNPYHLILGLAAGPDGQHGRIEQTHDGGHTWARLITPQPHTLVERFYEVHQTLFAVMDGGHVWAADLQEMVWHTILTDTPAVNAVTTMAG